MSQGIQNTGDGMDRAQKERIFWDNFAGRYDSFMKRTKPTYDRVIEKILRHVDASDNVLEIATGTGIIALAVAPSVRQVQGCDISPAMITVAERKLSEGNISNVHFSVCDAYDLPQEKDTFDVAIASNVLHVMISPGKALESVCRVLKPAGILIAPTYCHGNSIISRMVYRVMSLAGFRAYQRWSLVSFRQFLESVNLEIIGYEVIPDIIPLAFVVARKRGRR